MGFGDVAGGEVRRLVESWILGHLLMLSTDTEINGHRAQSRHRAEQLQRFTGVETPYADEYPEAERVKTTIMLVEELEAKLKQHDSKNGSMPRTAYDQLFRAESFLGAHPNITTLESYFDTKDNQIIPPKKPSLEDGRLWIAAIIVSYFAEQVFKTLELPSDRLDSLSSTIAEGADGLDKAALGLS
jgi:hypothetical protein